MIASGKTKPLFVLGCPRSGTTLLSGLLNQFDGVHIAQETGFIADLYQPEMDRLSRWPAKQLDHLMDQIWSYLSRQGWNNRPNTSDFVAYVQQTGKDGYDQLVKYCWQLESNDSAGLKFVGDNTPRYTLAIPLLNSLFPDARYINLVRDGRDVVCSLVNRHFGANSLLCAARSWMDHIGSWQMAERIIPADSRIEVRYEDLVSTLDQTRDRLSQFLMAPAQSTQTTLDAHGLADRMPHHSRLDSPIDSSSVGRYRTELTTRQLADVEAIMYSGLVAYDYEVGPFKPSAVMLDRSVLLTGSHVLDLMKRFVKKVQPCP